MSRTSAAGVGGRHVAAPPAAVVRPGEAVLRSLGDRLKAWNAGGRGIRLLNVGDSIATGAWGISHRSDHAIAVAARALASALGEHAGEISAIEKDDAAGLFGAERVELPARSDDQRVEWFTSGIGGARVRDLEAFLQADGGAGYAAYEAARPDLLTVWIGVNDTIHADEERVEDSASRLRRIVEELSARRVPLLLIAPNPVRTSHQPGPWSVAESYIQMFRPVSRELDVPLVEIAPRWGSYERAHAMGYLEDQVHPTRSGHADVGRLIAETLLAAAR